jgi:hypothetical protein
MADDLSDDEKQLQMDRGDGMDDEYEDVDAEIDPRRTGDDARQVGSMDGRPNGTTAKTASTI